MNTKLRQSNDIFEEKMPCVYDRYTLEPPEDVDGEVLGAIVNANHVVDGFERSES